MTYTGETMGKELPEKRRPGRKPKPMPARINASPEAVARMLVTAPPKKEEDWRYLKEQRSPEGCRD